MTITVNGSTNTITAPSGLTIAGVTGVSDATDATSTTAASLKTAGGLAVVKKGYFGDNIVMASGKGIDFSATANGSGTTSTEILSDYEEGTWTPAITFATPGDLSVAYGSRSGTYTKIGREVTVNFSLILSSFTHSTASGNAQITGLPFTASAEIASGSIIANGITAANLYSFVVYTPGSAVTYLQLGATPNNGTASAAFTTANLASGATLAIFGSITFNV